MKWHGGATWTWTATCWTAPRNAMYGACLGGSPAHATRRRIPAMHALKSVSPSRVWQNWERAGERERRVRGRKGEGAGEGDGDGEGEVRSRCYHV